MPVGTHAAVRSQGREDLLDSGVQVLLANTYHLMLRPGVDIFAIRRKPAGGGAEELIAPLNHSNYTIAKGDRLTAEVVITNKNIGHSFPPELRDFYEAYVEFVVSDDSGKVVYQSGFIKPDGYLDESAHNYKTYLVKADGTFLTEDFADVLFDHDG